MKRFLSFVTVGILVITLSACTDAAPAPEEPRAELAPFNFAYETTSGSLDYLVKSDDIVTLAATTPYYIDDYSLNLPGFEQFNELKRAKVQEAIRDTEKLFKAAKTLHVSVDEFKQALIAFLDVAVQAKSELKPFSKDIASQLATLFAQEEMYIAQYEGLKIPTQATDYTESFIAYQKTVVALDLAHLINQDLNTFVGNSLVLSTFLEADDAEEIKNALGVFETNMASLESLRSQLNELNTQANYVTLALQQIAASEHYFALAGMSYVQEELPELKTKLAALQPNDIITQTDIDFMNQYLDLFATFSLTINSHLSEVPQSAWVQSKEEWKFVWLPQIFADTSSYLNQSYDMLKGSLQQVGKGANLTWSAAKNSFKVAQTGIGITLDTLGAATKTGFDIAYTATGNGGSWRETAKEIKQNFQQIKENYTQGVSGASTLKTAEEYLEATENTAQEWFATGTAQYAGTGKVGSAASWGMGKLAKLTTGLFTGLGKGIMKVSNPQSTPGEYLDGMLDIGFSFIGGSKAVVKGSQLVAGSKETATLVGKNGLQFWQRMVNKLDRAELNRVTKEFLEKTGKTYADIIENISNISRQEKAEALNTILKETAQEINSRLIQSLQNGGKAIWSNSTSGTKDAYHEFVKETFEHSLTGLSDALNTTLGKSYKDYFDNISGAALDDLIKGIVKENIDKTVFGASFNGTYKGTLLIDKWPFPMTITIVDNTITGALITSFEFSLFGEPPTIIALNATITGSASAEGDILGTFQGNVTGADKPTTFSGSFGGKVTDESLNLNNIKAKTSGAKTAVGPYEVELQKE